MNESFFTERQLAKLYQTNFDLFVNNKLRVELDRMGHKWLGGCAVQVMPDGKSTVTLPIPDAFLVNAKADQENQEAQDEHDWGVKDEEMSLHQVLLNPSATSAEDAQVLPSMKRVPTTPSE